MNSAEPAPGNPRAGTIPALAAELLASTGRLRFRANGTSMLPTLRPGDELEFVAAGAGCAVGDVVLWRRDDRLFVHRVVSRNDAHLQTQGDALANIDEPVALDAVLGKLVAYRRGGRRRPSQRPGPIDRLFGWCMRRSDRVTRLFLQWHVVSSRLRGRLELVGTADPAL